MSFNLAVLMDPLETINPKKDSTLAMMLAAQSKGWTIYFLEQSGLFVQDGTVMANFQKLVLNDALEDWFQVTGEHTDVLASMDAVLMRKEPPFDMEFIYSTYLLEMAEKEGVTILNRPGSIRDCNEKLYALQFPQCCPPHLVSRNPEILKAFHAEHKDVIFKPLDGMGGSSIFRVEADDHNLNVIIETLTNYGQRQTMAQKFIPEIVDGDTRILLINGKPVPFGLARIPAKGETRGNLAAGGTGVTRPLTDRDRWICDQIGPDLKARGLHFVGIDVIGDYLTEINVTCPTCIREISKAHDIDIAGDFIDFIESIIEGISS